MRQSQEEKLAAASARELLKAQAARERKAGAAQSRKGASASTARKTVPAQKGKATGGAAATAEAVSSCRAAHMPEQYEGSGYSAGAHPGSFSDGSCFFNDAGNFFGDTPMSQPWMHSSDPAAW